ncbi:hypothetical protein [Micromonospora aurantiaca (nom. illeg.)]|uniref:hypothetical protein n=1 Tax=Micromonospora aurantiaca (nom. illeg.) TaxID=47850 RepID=UPI0036623FC5
MFLTDPVLRRIAADTNDVLPEQQWRHDTATAEPIGDLARLLHKTALDFTDSTTNLDQALTRLGALAETGRRGLAAHAGLYIPGHHQVVTDALAARERHTVLGVTLTACYRAWRNHRPMNEGDERHLLLRRCDPSRGVATLQRKDPDTWLVIPDAEAAAAFDIPYTRSASSARSPAPNGDGRRPPTLPVRIRSRSPRCTPCRSGVSSPRPAGRCCAGGTCATPTPGTTALPHSSPPPNSSTSPTDGAA